MTKLKHGQPLVIIGPQGSGKTIRAKEIAEKCGTYQYAFLDDILSDMPLDELLTGKPDTVIVEEAFCSKKQLARLKAVITKKGAPNFIFVSNSHSNFPEPHTSRRFRFLRIN
ncbi:MAG: hypothetical protein KZQ76_01220 [Candidatus Thiodiazotropha sp. (ex Epidulcina cf. delphinae)]|nr:hypothetical protein [Candidatus Thiodiazotropha sp. (ex Epidulcina cf. delphinae)]